MTAPPRSDLRTDLTADYANREGYVIIGSKDRNDPDPKNFEQKPFRWPHQRSDALNYILEKVKAGHCVYRPTSLCVGKSRTDTVPSNVLSFEVDQELTSDAWGLLKDVDATLIASGTPDHFHVKVTLDRDLPHQDIASLGEHLARACGVSGRTDSGGKWNPNDYLRVVGTFNTKLDPPVQVTVMHAGKGTTVEALRAILGDYPPPSKAIRDHGDIEPEEIAWDALPRGMRSYLKNDTEDGEHTKRGIRHRDFVYDVLVPDVRREVLTAGQAKYVSMHYYKPIQTKWPEHARAEDFDRLWGKAMAEKDKPLDSDPMAKDSNREAPRDGQVDNNTPELDDEFDIDPAILWEAKSRAVSSSFILSAPETVPALWGYDGTDVWWSPNEGLMLVADTGVGKTTLAGLLIRARMGYEGKVVGLPVVPGKGKVLYLAMDRPAQMQRSLRRQLLGKLTQDQMEAKFKVLPGPPIASFVTNPKLLLALARTFDADTVVIDSLKDAVVKLSDEEAGGSWNRAVQHCNAEGVETIVLHHHRKANADSRDKPRVISDVYGSNWLTAGMGSVVLMSRDAEDVELSQLKGPAGEGGKMTLKLDLPTGELLTLEEYKARTQTIEEKVLDYLKENPGASKRKVRMNVPGDNNKKDKAFDDYQKNKELLDDEV